MATRKKAPAPVDVDAIAARIVGQVAQRGGCSIASCKIPKPAQQDVLNRLRAQGLEVTKNAVRRPLLDQLRDLLASGAFVPLGGALKSHVSAATAAEAKQAALSLAAAGEAHVVARARTEFLVPVSAAVVPRDRLASSVKALEATLKLLKIASKKGSAATVLCDDLDALLAPLAPAARAVQATPALPSLPDVVTSLVEPAIGLAFVPAVVRELARHGSVASAHAALRKAAGRGEIELRPESGMGRLSPEDKALCIEGMDGAVLSWMRVPDGAIR